MPPEQKNKSKKDRLPIAVRMTTLVCRGLRSFRGHETFSAKSGEILGKLGELVTLITHVRKHLVGNLNLPGNRANCPRCSNCRPRVMGLFKKYSIEEFYVHHQNVRGRYGDILCTPCTHRHSPPTIDISPRWDVCYSR